MIYLSLLRLGVSTLANLFISHFKQIHHFFIYEYHTTEDIVQELCIPVQPDYIFPSLLLCLGFNTCGWLSSFSWAICSVLRFSIRQLQFIPSMTILMTWCDRKMFLFICLFDISFIINICSVLLLSFFRQIY